MHFRTIAICPCLPLVILLAVFGAFSLLLEDDHVKKIVTFLARVDLLTKCWLSPGGRFIPPFRATALIVNNLVLFHVLVLRRVNVKWTSFTFEKQKRTIRKAYLPYLRATIQDDIKVLHPNQLIAYLTSSIHAPRNTTGHHHLPSEQVSNPSVLRP